MAPALLQFLGTAAVIVVAGTFLARCADALAERTGLGRLLVGSVLLAAATSLPGLTVSVNAVRREGMPDLAVGDLLGASLMNLFALALLDLITRSRRRMLSKMSAAHAVSATMCILLVAVVALALRSPIRIDLWGVGSGVVAIVVAYALGLRLLYFDQRYASVAQPPVPASGPGLRPALAGFAVCAVAIFLAAPYLADAAARLAEITGAGPTFIGSTMLALATTLPELVTTLSAVRMGSFDLAVGNIFGS
ncbi:MAG: sodium:calcium antiporter [Planctomycetaceae bacterium]